MENPERKRPEKPQAPMHDQPAEGGREEIEQAIREQGEKHHAPRTHDTSHPEKPSDEQAA
jgi:hypothetical protein